MKRVRKSHATDLIKDVNRLLDELNFTNKSLMSKTLLITNLYLYLYFFGM